MNETRLSLVDSDLVALAGVRRLRDQQQVPFPQAATPLIPIDPQDVGILTTPGCGRRWPRQFDVALLPEATLSGIANAWLVKDWQEDALPIRRSSPAGCDSGLVCGSFTVQQPFMSNVELVTETAGKQFRDGAPVVLEVRQVLFGNAQPRRYLYLREALLAGHFQEDLLQALASFLPLRIAS